jgi:catechol 2,3-dioxygenase-like lactoylglutathione lyase family enzyme
MASINRVLTNICSDDLAKSEQFYTSLFNLKVAYTSDWFVHLTSDQAHFELGIILRTNDVVPEAHQNAPRGTYLTFVVDDVLAIF